MSMFAFFVVTIPIIGAVKVREKLGYEVGQSIALESRTSEAGPNGFLSEIGPSPSLDLAEG